MWVILILVTLVTLELGTVAVTSPKWLMTDDFVTYWTAGKLNRRGTNPYDPNQLLELQLQVGRSFGVPTLMWNPPWMMSLVMPFSLISYPLSRTIWLFSFILIIFFCVNTLWSLYGGMDKSRYLSWVIGLTFIPVLDALKTGQTGPLLLLGVSGFLYYLKREKDFLAGLFISLLIIKPQVLLLFGIAVFLWTLRQKRWYILLGVSISLTLGTLIVWAINPLVIRQYIFAIRNYPPNDWATPTIGGVSRLIFGTEYFWLQFVAPILGLVWFFYYWFKHHLSWNWLERAPILILVSNLTAAYGWSYDLPVALVAIVQVVVSLVNTKSNVKIIVLSVYILINILLLIFRTNQIYTFWLAPAMLAWYFWSFGLQKQHVKDNL